MTTVSMLLGNVSSGYAVNNSLRFRSSASAYLNRTFGSPTNAIKWTWSAWVKLGALTVNRNLFTAASTGTANIQLQNDNTLTFYQYNSGYQYNRITTQVFRDPSAWYHIVAVYDSANATASNRVLLYINGAQITSFSSSTDPSLNYAGYFNASGQSHVIGGTSGAYFDGYITEVNFIDGQALTPTSFGSYSTTTGVWQPIKYAGTYGTNGFYLKFNNTTSTTTLGYDNSGNSNNWTCNNISLTAGSTYDAMIDSPTLSAAASNYAVLNPLSNYGYTLTSGNLLATLSSSGAYNYQTRGSMAVSSGKWYFELGMGTISGTGTPIIGVCDPSLANTTGLSTSTSAWLYYGYNGQKYNGSGTAYGSTWGSNANLAVALDMDNGTITFYLNGTSQGTAFTNLSGKTVTPVIFHDGASETYPISANFGQQPFTYTPPSGFRALNTYNLPTPAIANGALYNAATLYTGTGSSQSIVNSQSNGGNNALGKTFYPDFIWAKNRTSADTHVLSDSVRGPNYQLFSNLTNAEQTNSTYVTSFNSNGISVGNSSGGTGDINQVSGNSYVLWQWNAGSGTYGSNTNGSITSTVSVNQTAGFSVLTYTGTGANATVGHGLGIAPSMIIIKSRSAGSTDWNVYHVSTGNTGAMFLDLNNAFAADSTKWNNTSPTSSVFTIGTSAGVNSSGGNYVAYCWAAIAGYSAFGSYTGNGSTDGPFVYCGFRPRFVLFKCSSTPQDWVIYDTSRDTYNAVSNYLLPDSSAAEGVYANADFLSNGFKLKNTASLNYSGYTYIYAAFAENPFKYALAR